MHLSRRITSLSCEDPFEMAATRSRLSHWNNTLVLESLGPHTAQLRAIGTSSFAMVDALCHSLGHSHWSQFPSKKAPQPQLPEASV